MTQFIEAVVRYNKMMENGKVKKIKEPYLVDAFSFSESEAKVTEEVTPYISGEFTVSAIKKTNISEIFRSESSGMGCWYKVKANFINLDEKSGTEKKTPVFYLVEANDFHNAYENFIDAMKGTMADFSIDQICLTTIMDVI